MGLCLLVYAAKGRLSPAGNWGVYQVRRWLWPFRDGVRGLGMRKSLYHITPVPFLVSFLPEAVCPSQDRLSQQIVLPMMSQQGPLWSWGVCFTGEALYHIPLPLPVQAMVHTAVLRFWEASSDSASFFSKCLLGHLRLGSTLLLPCAQIPALPSSQGVSSVSGPRMVTGFQVTNPSLIIFQIS